MSHMTAVASTPTPIVVEPDADDKRLYIADLKVVEYGFELAPYRDMLAKSPTHVALSTTLSIDGKRIHMRVQGQWRNVATVLCVEGGKSWSDAVSSLKLFVKK